MKIFYMGRLVQPNQHARWYHRLARAVWYHTKQAVIRIGFTGLVISIAYTAGAYSVPEHVTATTVIQKVEHKFPAILEKICKAESDNRQFKENGRVLRGKVNPSDIGECQINEPIWNDKARELGFDIYTQEGNRAMALWIFENYGTDPWNSSKANWKK